MAARKSKRAAPRAVSARRKAKAALKAALRRAVKGGMTAAEVLEAVRLSLVEAVMSD